MKNYKIFSLLIILLLFRESDSQKIEEPEEISVAGFVEIPPPFLRNSNEIQINSIPSPLNFDGRFPFAIWLNGEQIPADSSQIKKIKEILNLQEVDSSEIAEIHNGRGWLRPRNLE